MNLHSNRLPSYSAAHITPSYISANPAHSQNHCEMLQSKNPLFTCKPISLHTLKFPTHISYTHIQSVDYLAGAGQCWEKEVEKEEEAPSVQESWVPGSLLWPLSHPSVPSIPPRLNPTTTPPPTSAPPSPPLNHKHFHPASFHVKSGSVAGIHCCCLIQWPHDV